jgi:hypothetical protein
MAFVANERVKTTYSIYVNIRIYYGLDIAAYFPLYIFLY